MRRLLILAGLYAVMLLVLPAGTDSSARLLLTFGFLVLAAYSVGELAPSFALPKIVGYMFGGLLFGPSALGIVETGDVQALDGVGKLAIALIAFLAGAELQWDDLKQRGRQLMTLTGLEMLVAFVAVFGLLLALKAQVPFLQQLPWFDAVVFAGIFATITMIHSPAVTMALLTETGATGVYARTTLGVVLLADVVGVLVFSLVMAGARALMPAEGVAGSSLWLLAWEIVGAVPIGVLLGLGVTLYLRYVRTELFLFAVLVAFFGQEVSRLTHVESLLMLLVAGFVTQNLTGDAGTLLRHAMERAAAPIFVVFFALAGAKLDVAELTRLWPLVVPLAVIRILALYAGTRWGAAVSKLPAPETRDAWMGLVAQAGVAIGLVSIVGESYPQVGGEMRTMLLSLVAINQIIGPILFRRALTRNERREAESAMASESAVPEATAAAVAQT